MYVILGLVMLLRGFADAHHDARPAGGRIRRPARLPAAAPLRPDLHRARRDHDLLRGDAARHGPDELRRCRCRSARATSRFPFLNNFSFWMTASGAGAGDDVAVRRRIRAHRLARLSAAVGHLAQSRRRASITTSGRCRSPVWAPLLSGVNLLATIVKMRAPGMSMMKMPIFTWTTLCTNILIVAAFPVLTAVLALLSLDRYVGTQLLHQRPRRQPDDVRQPHLDLGPSRGLHPDPAGLRHLLRGRLHLQRQAAVRLRVDGLRHRGDHASCRTWSGCTTSSRWARARA